MPDNHAASEHREEGLFADALHDDLLWAARAPGWEELLPVPEVVDELERWVEDDAQWRTARKAHWTSLLQDLEDSLKAMPDSVLALAETVRGEELLAVLRRLRQGFPEAGRGAVRGEARRRQARGSYSG